jgi:hypothetical protein
MSNKTSRLLSYLLGILGAVAGIYGSWLLYLGMANKDTQATAWGSVFWILAFVALLVAYNLNRRK